MVIQDLASGGGSAPSPSTILCHLTYLTSAEQALDVLHPLRLPTAVYAVKVGCQVVRQAQRWTLRFGTEAWVSVRQRAAAAAAAAQGAVVASVVEAAQRYALMASRRGQQAYRIL